MLQLLAVLCWPVMLPSSGHRWGAAGRWPSPRARRCAEIITWWATRSGSLATRGGSSQAGASCSAATACGAVSAGDVAEQGSPVGRCWAMAKSPGWTAGRGHHLVGGPVRRPGSQGRVIEGRSELQCCNRSRCSVGRRRCRARVTGGALLGDGQVPGRGGAPRSSPGGRPDPAAWPPGAGDRGEEQAAVLQQFETPCWPATLSSRNHRWEHCWAKYPGGTAGRNHHLVGEPVRKAVALLDNGALGGKGRFSLQSCNN